MLIMFALTIVASFVGSLHCAGMCGPISIFIHQSGKGKSLLFYHLGRLTIYIVLGGIFFFLGSTMDSYFKNQLFSYSYIIGFGFLLLAGVLQILEGMLHIQWRHKISFFSPKIFKNLSSQISRQSFLYPYWMGLITGLIPCGWLYSFVIGSLVTKSILENSLFMTSFWLGGLPALLFVQGLHKTFKSLVPWTLSPVLLSLLFFFLSAYSFWYRGHEGLNTSCHTETAAVVDTKNPN